MFVKKKIKKYKSIEIFIYKKTVVSLTHPFYDLLRVKNDIVL